jgi:hypothetical protein
MSQIGFHPAPGLGDLAPGWFVVPQNPLRNDSTVLVPSVQASAGGRMVKKPHIGDFVAGSFVVPQNPVRRNLATGMMGLGGGLGCGCGTPDCGSGSGANPYGLQGLGDLDLTATTDWLQAPSLFSAIPNWALYGGIAFAAYILLSPGGSAYRRERIESQSYHTGYQRLGRALSGGGGGKGGKK